MSPRRFVVLRHEVGPEFTRQGGTHCDWMFQLDDALRTWATDLVDRFDHPIQTIGRKLQDHRIDYLDYQGNLSGNRGSVTRLLAGNLTVVDDTPDRLVARLAWIENSQDCGAWVAVQRIMLDSKSESGEPPSVWTLSFSPGLYETNR